MPNFFSQKSLHPTAEVVTMGAIFVCDVTVGAVAVSNPAAFTLLLCSIRNVVGAVALNAVVQGLQLWMF